MNHEKLILDLITTVPDSLFTPHNYPVSQSRRVIARASARAATLSAGLSLPGGAVGFLTLIPDLLGIWRIQAQMVADIAAIHGKVGMLGREEMAWCLFRHASSQLVRDLAMQAGQRVLATQTTRRALHFFLRKLGIGTSHKVAQRLLLRSIPLLGSLGSGAYAWYDTRKVGATAIELFESPQLTPPT